MPANEITRALHRLLLDNIQQQIVPLALASSLNVDFEDIMKLELLPLDQQLLIATSTASSSLQQLASADTQLAIFAMDIQAHSSDSLRQLNEIAYTVCNNGTLQVGRLLRRLHPLTTCERTRQSPSHAWPEGMHAKALSTA